jgi:hypothetical protein
VNGLLILLFLVFGLFLNAPCLSASTFVPVDDESYYLLQRLEAEGVVTGSILTTRPISSGEMARLVFEAEQNAGGRNTVVREMVRRLKEIYKPVNPDTRFVKPFDSPYIKYAYTDSDIKNFSYNQEGDSFDKGSNLRAGLTSVAEFRWISFSINPEVRYSEDDTDVIARRAYGVLDLSGVDITAGMDSQWWGPGYHGSILLSDNPAPVTMLRISNPHPVLLPWILRYLGPFRVTAFVSKLEEERKNIPEPYFWGMRMNFKPLPWFEFGIQRTALLGGKGRSEGLNTWWKSFSGRGENKSGSGSGDQRAGCDVKITLPFRWQPVQFYAEATGEDEAGSLPSKWAYLAGVYLPGFITLDRVDLRAEYATTHVSGSPGVWYNHSVYKSGYTYKGRVIGHHMGTDSRDIFLEAAYLMPEFNGRISVSFDMEEHNLSGTIREKDSELALKADMRFAENLACSILYSHGEAKNPGNMSADDKKSNTVSGMIHLSF